MKKLCGKLDKHIRFRLRMCIWKHWKTPKNREKNLIKLGLPRRAAHGISYAKGYARVCRSWNLHIGISKERLAKFGLVSMEDYYAKGGLLVKLIEPPCTERYARWCERSVGEIIAYLLLDFSVCKSCSYMQT